MDSEGRGSAPGSPTLSEGSPPPVDSGVPGAEHTVGSYWNAFSPVPAWSDVPSWPPDVFAFANLVLDHTEAFRFGVAPPRGRHWPPTLRWNETIVTAARAWREAIAADEPPPELVRRLWGVVSGCRETPMTELRSGTPWRLCEALLTLHALADEACSELAGAGRLHGQRSFEARAWALLANHGSLARLSSSRVRITPKIHFASRGITIRSLSRYLALCYESVDVRWRRVEPADLPPGQLADRPERNFLLLPWPLAVSASAFRPVSGPLDMDPDAFGFFAFDPTAPLDVLAVQQVVEEATRSVSNVDALLLPEAAVTMGEIPVLEEILDQHGVGMLVAGVRERGGPIGFGRNYVHVGVRTTTGWRTYEQDKHHRWCLDGPQIAQYGLSRALEPRKLWWEAIELPARTVQIVDLGTGVTWAPLVCEDLARMDEVTDLLRRIGPSLIVAILLDGPQLSTRWPCRYASVLTDEPGSSVLTLTSFGMAVRSRPAGRRRSRAVALWSDRRGGRREITLNRGATAVLMTLRLDEHTVWTADGRRHEGSSPDLVLSEVHQIRTEPNLVASSPGPSSR